jgi:hypothetical protein
MPGSATKPASTVSPEVNDVLGDLQDRRRVPHLTVRGVAATALSHFDFKAGGESRSDESWLPGRPGQHGTGRLPWRSLNLFAGRKAGETSAIPGDRHRQTCHRFNYAHDDCKP